MKKQVKWQVYSITHNSPDNDGLLLGKELGLDEGLPLGIALSEGTVLSEYKMQLDWFKQRIFICFCGTQTNLMRVWRKAIHLALNSVGQRSMD